MDTKTLLSQMTVEEKAALVSGTDFMYTNPIPRLGIPSLSMADGPHGLRKQTGDKDNGSSGSEPATAFPAAVTTASSWNPENTHRMGEAIGRECRHYGVNILLGPGVNIKRNPLCGRNFEYFSEDPLLAARMASAQVQGLDSCGVAACVKHFALNNSENYRFMGDSIADGRAIREVYLKAFEWIVKESRPAALMCAYNKVNGTYCSQNEWLLDEVLRKEWGFDGLVMTDWGAMHDRVASLEAGLDLEMPGDTPICRRQIIDSVQSGRLRTERLDAACKNVLKLLERCLREGEPAQTDWDTHHRLAGEIAADSAVLLKNDGVFPLDREQTCLVAGELFEKMRYQGAGSSMIHAARVTSPKDAFDGAGVSYEYVRGYAVREIEPRQELISEAVERAKDCETVVVFAGLTDDVESEGCDRADMKLPANQLALLEALIRTGKKVAVVLFGGGVTELPFADEVCGILHMFLPGQNGGTAVQKLLFGERNPCGRLAETWPLSYGDVPLGQTFGKGPQEVYRESIFVGYRYYLTAGKPVRYPFGYGLSYTSFAYSDLAVKQKDHTFHISCEVENIGGCDGADVVQLYVKAPVSDVFKPSKELRAFAKVYLKAGERKSVFLTVEEEDLRYFHVGEGRWVLEGGTYEFQICSDCQTVQLAQPVELRGETVAPPYCGKVAAAYGQADVCMMTDEIFEQMSGQAIPPLPPRFPITMESRFTDLRQTFMGRILYNAVMFLPASKMRAAKRLPEGPERDNGIKGATFLRRILESGSLISMFMSAGGHMPYHLARGFMELTNGHFFRGLRCFLFPVKAPPLPKKQKKRS